MKHPIIITFLISLLSFNVSVFAQTKIDEYGNISTDRDSGRLDAFVIELQNDPKATGLFIVYLGENKKGIGNIQTYLEGVKKYVSDRGFDIDRVSFVIAEGKESFTRELWLINEGDKSPEFTEAKIELPNLAGKILFASFCNDCSPTVLSLRTDTIDWNLLGRILNENPNYMATLQIGKGNYYDIESEKKMNARKYVKKLRKRFLPKHKINKNRFKYNIIENEGGVSIFIENKVK